MAWGSGAAVTTFELDGSTRRVADDVVVGGSPLRLFRLTRAGVEAFERVAAGDDVGPSKLVDRLVDSGAIHPPPHCSPHPAAPLTVGVPAFGLDSDTLRDIVGCCPGVTTVIVVDDASDPPVSSIDGTKVLRLR